MSQKSESCLAVSRSFGVSCGLDVEDLPFSISPVAFIGSDNCLKDEARLAKDLHGDFESLFTDILSPESCPSGQLDLIDQTDVLALLALIDRSLPPLPLLLTPCLLNTASTQPFPAAISSDHPINSNFIADSFVFAADESMCVQRSINDPSLFNLSIPNSFASGRFGGCPNWILDVSVEARSNWSGLGKKTPEAFSGSMLLRNYPETCPRSYKRVK